MKGDLNTVLTYLSFHRNHRLRGVFGSWRRFRLCITNKKASIPIVLSLFFLSFAASVSFVTPLIPFSKPDVVDFFVFVSFFFSSSSFAFCSSSSSDDSTMRLSPSSIIKILDQCIWHETIKFKKHRVERTNILTLHYINL